MNKQQIIQETEKFVRENVPSSRKYKDGSDTEYLDHVFDARKYAIELAKLYEKDKFVVEIAALLHDTGGNAGKYHAKESVKISKSFLSKFDLPDDILSNILDCIANHSMGSIPKTDEQQIIQDADGIIFIEDTYKFFFEKYKNKLPLEEAREMSIEKTKGMMAKIKTDKGIELANERLPKAIKYLKNFLE